MTIGTTIEGPAAAIAERSHSAVDAVNVLYLVYREALSSVFTAQVLAPLSRHRGDVNARLGVFSPVGHLVRPQWRTRFNRVRREAGEEYAVPMTCLPSAPTRWRWLWNDEHVLRRWVKKQFGSGEPFVMHCRGCEMAMLAIRVRDRLPRARVVFDCRGVDALEYRQSQGLDNRPMESWTPEQRARFERLEAQTGRAALDSDHVFCVSSALGRHLAETYGVDARRVTAVPCCPDVDRFAAAAPSRPSMREELGLADKLVVAYCGSMLWYQQPDQCLRVFRLIQSLDPRAHFLAVTTQPDRMRRAIGTARVAEKVTTVVQVPPTEVPRYLAASDLGLLLRDASLVNRVASPVKFGEYLASGLPVVLAGCIGDYSALMRTHRLGVEVDLSQPDERLAGRLGELITHPSFVERTMSRRCRDVARRELSWERHLPRMADVYRRLVNGPSGRHELGTGEPRSP